MGLEEGGWGGEGGAGDEEDDVPVELDGGLSEGGEGSLWIERVLRYGV